MKTTLCVLFNHPYPKNIPVLREFLKDRFSDVLFVQPMVRSPDRDVLTSYRGSYTNHGMIADIAASLMRRKSDCYAFVQDDVLLNPLLNERNLGERLRLSRTSAFMPSIAPLGGVLEWEWYIRILWKLYYPMNSLSGSGVEHMLAHLPDPDEARSAIEAKYGFTFEGVRYDRNRDVPELPLFLDPALSKATTKIILEGLFSRRGDRNLVELPYPFCFGLADFFAVGGDLLEEVAHMLGVFAAAETFVETAVATSLAVASDRVVQQQDVGLTCDWRWGEGRELSDPAALMERFREDLLFVHPIKISGNAGLLSSLHERSIAS